MLSSQSLSVGHVRTERPVNEFGSLSSSVRENPCRDTENEQIRILLERQKEQIVADCTAEIQKHKFRILIATVKPESRMRRNSKSDAASSSQVRLQDAYLGGSMDTATVKPVATKDESGDVDLSESETWSFQDEAVTERPIAYQTATDKPYAFSNFVPPVPLRVENYEAKCMARSLYTFNGSDENIELLLRTVISANQLNVYGAIPDLCNELSEDFRASGKPETPDHIETMEIPTGPSIAETHTNAQQRETWPRREREWIEFNNQK